MKKYFNNIIILIIIIITNFLNLIIKMVSKAPKFLGNDILYHAIIHSNIKDVVGLLDG